MKSAILLVAFSGFLTIASLAQGKKPTHTKHTTDKTALSKNACPHCHSSAHVIPIVYGRPANETMKKAERGEIKLGGCVMAEKNPHFYCKKDKHEF